MSSGTSTRSGAASADRSGFRPWQFFVLAGLVAATIGVFLSRDASPWALVLTSLAIGSAALAGMALYRTVVPLVSPDIDTPETLGHRTRAALEREKTLVLRSIKELEFDKAMGKVAEGDFDEMAARLRARAIGLMTQLDAGGSGYRELIERELQARLAPMGIRMPPPQPPAVEPHPDAPAARVTSGRGNTRAASAAFETGRGCEVCQTVNDLDARFCKQCGQPLEASEPQG
jgi:hypothetical protein